MAQQNPGTAAPSCNRVYLFNYFERHQEHEDSIVNFWTEAALYMQTKDHFISTHLHRSLEKENRFSWVNFAVFDSDDVSPFGKPDPVWGELIKNMFACNIKSFPGQYNEIDSYLGENLTEDSKERSDECRFLLTAVMAEESITNGSLEANWKSWTKADFVQQKLKDNANSKDSLLYRMVKSPAPLVRYSVRTELGKMSDDDGATLAEEINNQADAAGVQTFTAFYKIHANIFYKKE